jgi:MFS family permease
MRTVPFSVWRLMLAYSLMMAGVSVMVLIAGIIGAEIAPTEGLATLPIALSVVGVAASTLPTGRLLGAFGRRTVFLAYGLIAITAALLAAVSLVFESFSGLCAAAFLMGWAGAAGHQYRFAALELVPAHLAPKATSVLLLGGILSAFIGPELAVRGRGLLEADYAGSFLLLTLAYLAGMIIVSFYKDITTLEAKETEAGRPLVQIMRTPNVVLAISAAALGYGIMSFIMTATPISMHVHAGHSLESTKLVIQSHIAAMYLPSLVYAWFFSKLGFRGMFWAGSVVYLLCLAIALINTQFIHFWLALVMVGVGWNFLFLSGTNLLPLGYRPNERFRVQAANDFLVFSIQAIASLSSGWVLYIWKWDGVLWACVPLVLAFLVLLWLSKAPVAGASEANGK